MSLQVIGAGFGRTGTASLKLALERLGLGPCHHMTEVLPDAGRVALWTRIGGGEPLWDEAFAGYRATVDWPACTYWRELAEHYPLAKVILSTRDAGSWFESVNETILSARASAALAPTPMGAMLEKTIWRLFDGRMDDREHMVACFERHNAEVIAGLPPERLLVFEARDGWGPLCEFLGVEVPDEPYPRVNSREETMRAMAMLAQQSAGGEAPTAETFSDVLLGKESRTRA